jgi:hypothetical protein
VADTAQQTGAAQVPRPRVPDRPAQDWHARDWQELPGGAARPDERLSRYCQVECAACGAAVLAAKFSVQHTSVQWDAAALRQCAEFVRRAAAGEQTPLIERCASMRASIDAAALDGQLPVSPPWLTGP